ncbi:MAG: hypothetical protein HYX79_10570 [Chloroflexi bacterium]|nr:hypothetical protein [Chloroflexota bacterium]
MRASVAAEKTGVPSSSVVCEGFAIQGRTTAAGFGLPNLPLARYPGAINLHKPDELQKNVESILADQVIKGLTTQPEEARPSTDPEPRDIVFQGDFEGVNEFFYRNEWSEGIPIVPPTIEKVEEFLKFTDRSANEVLGVLLPTKSQATVWNIAVNGVMAGCLPEYMPVLVAMVEAMADPKFGQEHLGHTPGTEVLITLNGPIIKELGFNYEQGALRPGFRANTSTGRFWRLYLRNVAGFMPHKTDKATFGGTWRVVLAENEDALAEMGWQPMSVDQGFKAGDNVVTVSSCTSTDSIYSAGEPSPEQILDKLAARTVDIQLYLFALSLMGPSVRPQLIMSPSVAGAVAKGGFSKAAVKQYLYEHAKFPATRFERLLKSFGPLCKAAEEGRLPKVYCESTKPDRLVPIVWSPEDFMLTVSGDPGRDNCFICANNGFIGYPVSKKIDLPKKWRELRK